MIDRQKVIETARKLRGVRFVHQGRDPRVGLDCIGLVNLSLLAGGWQPCRPDLSLRTDYARLCDGKLFSQLAQEEGEPVTLEQAQPADVVLMTWRSGKIPHHVALVTMRNPERPDQVFVCHTDATFGAVCEELLCDDLLNRIVGIYRIKDESC